MDRVEAKSYLHAAKSHSSSSLNSSRPALPEVASNESYRRLAERQDRLDELLAWMADKLTSLEDKITKIYHGKAHASVTDDDVLQVFEKRINQPQHFKKLVDKAAETTWPGLAISHFANYYAFKQALIEGEKLNWQLNGENAAIVKKHLDVAKTFIHHMRTRRSNSPRREDSSPSERESLQTAYDDDVDDDHNHDHGGTPLKYKNNPSRTGWTSFTKSIIAQLGVFSESNDVKTLCAPLNNIQIKDAMLIIAEKIYENYFLEMEKAPIEKSWLLKVEEIRYMLLETHSHHLKNLRRKDAGNKGKVTKRRKVELQTKTICNLQDRENDMESYNISRTTSRNYDIAAEPVQGKTSAMGDDDSDSEYAEEDPQKRKANNLALQCLLDPDFVLSEMNSTSNKYKNFDQHIASPVDQVFDPNVFLGQRKKQKLGSKGSSRGKNGK